MKPKNFPAKKLMRQLRAQGEVIRIYGNDIVGDTDHIQMVQQALDVRTKKHRGSLR